MLEEKKMKFNLLNIYNTTKKKDIDKNNINKHIIEEKGNFINANNNLNSNCFKLLLIMIVFISFLIFIPNVYSLGITPGKTTVNYEKGQEINTGGVIQILNNEHKNIEIVLMIKNEVDESIKVFLSENKINLLPSEESKDIKYKLNIPASFDGEPGAHSIDIVALEVPKAKEDGTFVGATVAVVSQLEIYVPYPGKYLDADLNVLDAEQNSTAVFVVPIINRGELGIGEARAIIDVYSNLNQKIDTIQTDYLPVNPGQRTELSAKWNVSVPSGDYLAKVSLFYDGETRNFEKAFSIGTKKLSIESILVNNFQLGEIAKLQILVENRWNKNLENVYANLLVYNKRSDVMADIKSSTESVGALTKKELIAYWDTVGVAEGEYNGKLMVYYDQKSADNNLVLKVSQDSLDIVGVGYAIRPSGGSEGINITTILLVLVILLLIVNLAWFVFFRRIMGSRKAGKK